MALILAKTTDSGAIAQYWKLASDVSINKSQAQVFFKMQGYLTKELREAGAAPAMEMSFSYSYDVAANQPLWPSIYEASKSLDFFAGAADDI